MPSRRWPRGIEHRYVPERVAYRYGALGDGVVSSDELLGRGALVAEVQVHDAVTGQVSVLIGFYVVGDVVIEPELLGDHPCCAHQPAADDHALDVVVMQCRDSFLDSVDEGEVAHHERNVDGSDIGLRFLPERYVAPHEFRFVDLAVDERPVRLHVLLPELLEDEAPGAVRLGQGAVHVEDGEVQCSKI